MCSSDLVSQMDAVYNQVEAMKQVTRDMEIGDFITALTLINVICNFQYHEDISQLNDPASKKPRQALIADIQEENRNITDLQQENRELRVLIEEQQNALDLIMTKYRQNVSRLFHCDDLDKKIFELIEANTKVSPSGKLVIL